MGKKTQWISNKFSRGLKKIAKSQKARQFGKRALNSVLNQDIHGLKAVGNDALQQLKYQARAQGIKKARDLASQYGVDKFIPASLNEKIDIFEKTGTVNGNSIKNLLSAAPDMFRQFRN